MTNTDEYWMQQALEMAAMANGRDEVPVGAIVVVDNKVIGRGFNQPIGRHDPTAHAEIMALRDAANALQNYRLVEATLYVTLEPCTMCVGAIIHSRVQRLVFGAYEPKAGAVVSQLQLLTAPFYNHQLRYTGGICEQQCSDMISQFFSRRREQQRREKESR